MAALCTVQLDLPTLTYCIRCCF